MILTFSEDKFETRIKAGTKYTTFREDKLNRWDVGMKIHFWRGNPRNTRGKNKPHTFGNGEVTGIMKVRIYPTKDRIRFIGHSLSLVKDLTALNTIAIIDGFDNWQDMKQWFISRGKIDPKGYRMKRIIFKFDESV